MGGEQEYWASIWGGGGVEGEGGALVDKKHVL